MRDGIGRIGHTYALVMRVPMCSLLAMVVIAAVGASTAVLGVSSAAAQPDDRGQLVWQPCRASSDAECARLTVPLDDTDPSDSRTIDLALSRVRARDPEHRIGSLLVNPGGPGAPGAAFAAQLAGVLPDEIQDRFDIVGWDPRGSGRSAGVQCNDRLDSYYALDWDPDTAAERRDLEDATRAFVDSCVERSGTVLPYVASDRTVRDMDRIRATLGEPRLSYLGFSYGTYLGAKYAEAYPQNVRALVLDGATDPALDATAVQVEQAVGFERALRLFLRSCARSDLGARSTAVTIRRRRTTRCASASTTEACRWGTGAG